MTIKVKAFGSPSRVRLQESPMHKALFWVAVAVLQLDEVNLYSAGTALLEQNLHTLDTMRVFNDKVTQTERSTRTARCARRSRTRDRLWSFQLLFKNIVF